MALSLLFFISPAYGDDSNRCPDDQEGHNTVWVEHAKSCCRPCPTGTNRDTGSCYCSPPPCPTGQVRCGQQNTNLGLSAGTCETPITCTGMYYRVRGYFDKDDRDMTPDSPEVKQTECVAATELAGKTVKVPHEQCTPSKNAPVHLIVYTGKVLGAKVFPNLFCPTQYCNSPREIYCTDRDGPSQSWCVDHKNTTMSFFKATPATCGGE